MKKEYACCILSLIVLSLGITCCLSVLLINSISYSNKSVLAVFGICFMLVGMICYAEHNKKYLKIKYLTNKDVPILAAWRYKPNTSLYIDETIFSNKYSTSSTVILSCILCFVIACCIYFSNEKYCTEIALFITAVTLLATSAALMVINYYYDQQLYSDSEVIFGEDCIYFLGELYGLQKSIFFLQDVRIDFSIENSLQFLYGSVKNDPVYIIKVPIPDGQLGAAELIQSHYLDLIHYE